MSGDWLLVITIVGMAGAPATATSSHVTKAQCVAVMREIEPLDFEARSFALCVGPNGEVLRSWQ